MGQIWARFLKKQYQIGGNAFAKKVRSSLNSGLTLKNVVMMKLCHVTMQNPVDLATFHKYGIEQLAKVDYQLWIKYLKNILIQSLKCRICTECYRKHGIGDKKCHRSFKVRRRFNPFLFYSSKVAKCRTTPKSAKRAWCTITKQDTVENDAHTQLFLFGWSLVPSLSS